MVNIVCLEAFANDKGLTAEKKEVFLRSMEDLQAVVDTMKEMPRYAQFVHQRKLSLISDEYKPLDTLLTLGILE